MYGLYIHDNIIDSENNGSYSLPSGISLGEAIKSVLIENNRISNATPALLLQPRIYGVSDVIFRYNACLGIRNVTGSGASQGIIMRGAGMAAYNDPAPYDGWQAGDLMPVENLQIYGNILQSYYMTGANGCYGLLMDTDTNSCWKGDNIVISDNIFANFSGGAAFISNFDEMNSLSVSGNRTDNCGQIWDGGAGQLTTPIRVSALGTQTNVTVSNNPSTGKTIGAVFTQHNDRVVMLVNNGTGVPSPCTAVVSQFLNGTLTDSRNIDVEFASDGSFGTVVDFSDSSANTYSYTVELIETPVIISVSGVSLDIDAATVEIGDTQQLTALVSPDNATDADVSFSSDNTAVAQVDSNGLVTAYSAGTANITVTTADGGFTDTCVITVPASTCLHTGVYTIIGSDATCTQDGYTTGTYCPDCGMWTEGHIHIPALNHKNAYTVAGTPATCTEAGQTDGTYCPDCETWRTPQTTIGALGHNYTSAVSAPTCTAQGYTTHTCSRCGDSYTDTQIAALGHNYTSAVSAPTCTAQGYTTHTCSRCNASHTSNVTAALGHIDDNADGYCDFCGKDIRIEEPQPEQSFFEKIAAFFQRIIDFFKNLFS